jgi:hypothetical protein
MEFDIKSNLAADSLKGSKKEGKAKTNETESNKKDREKRRNPRDIKEGRQRKRKKMTHGIKINGFC